MAGLVWLVGPIRCAGTIATTASQDAARCNDGYKPVYGRRRLRRRIRRYARYFPARFKAEMVVSGRSVCILWSMAITIPALSSQFSLKATSLLLSFFLLFLLFRTETRLIFDHRLVLLVADDSSRYDQHNDAHLRLIKATVNEILSLWIFYMYLILYTIILKIYVILLKCLSKFHTMGNI